MEPRNYSPSARDVNHFQFYCTEHNYGWSIDEDGQARGCIHCYPRCEACGTDCDWTVAVNDGIRVCVRCLMSGKLI